MQVSDIKHAHTARVLDVSKRREQREKQEMQLVNAAFDMPLNVEGVAMTLGEALGLKFMDNTKLAYDEEAHGLILARVGAMSALIRCARATLDRVADKAELRSDLHTQLGLFKHTLGTYTTYAADGEQMVLDGVQCDAAHAVATMADEIIEHMAKVHHRTEHRFSNTAGKSF